MLELFMVGMLLQAFTWCLSYAVVARGDKKLFLLTEIYNFSISIFLKVYGFYLAGLDGVGVAFVADYVFELLLIYIVCHRKYRFRLSTDCLMVVIYSVVICTITLVSVYVLSSYWRYVIGIVLLILAFVYSVNELNKRVNLKTAILKFRK